MPRRLELTKHVPRPAVLAKELFVGLQCVRQSDQKLSPTLQASHLATLLRLQALSHLFDGQLSQTLSIDLVLFVLVTRENTL